MGAAHQPSGPDVVLAATARDDRTAVLRALQGVSGALCPWVQNKVPDLRAHEGSDAMTETFDERLKIALREATRHHLTAFASALRVHNQHPGFQLRDWAQTREYGFTCPCQGQEAEWRISVMSLKEKLPDARESALAMFQRIRARGNKGRKREERKANVRAKALLFRHLTREQKWDLRARRAFDVQGGDGRTYTLSADESNITLDHDGRHLSLCIGPEGNLPSYDKMLVRKILAEADPERMLRTACVHDCTNKQHYSTGAFIVTGEPPPVQLAETGGPGWRPLDIPSEDLDEPEQWVRARANDSNDVGP